METHLRGNGRKIRLMGMEYIPTLMELDTKAIGKMTFSMVMALRDVYFKNLL